MKTLIIILMLTINAIVVKSQNVISVVSGNTNTFYTNLDTAIAHANNGDYIYVPGGSWTLNNPINKGVNIVGVGYFADSSVATGITQINSINNSVSILSGADNGSITGVNFFNTGVIFGYSNNEVNNYSLIRCIINNELIFYPTSSNILITENILETNVVGNNNQSIDFSKNIFVSGIEGFGPSCTFDNNIFLYSSTGILLNQIFNNVFSNNIFLANNIDDNSSSYAANNIFYNNLFVGNQTNDISNNTYINSLYAITQSTIFVNLTGNYYDPNADYLLQTSCLGHNYGTDGTDVGIYGTGNPFKVGSIPFNPHVQFKSINSSTNTNGDLPVNIQVEAQDH